MARHRTHSVEFKRQIAQEHVAGETFQALAKRHDLSRNLMRIWVTKLETGAFDDDARAADLLESYEAKIAALERMADDRRLCAPTIDLTASFSIGLAVRTCGGPDVQP